MDVFFVSERLATLLCSPDSATRKFGTENAKWIAKRLDNLRFASNLEAMYLLPGRFHELTGDRAGTFAIYLKYGYRIILKPADSPPPRKPDGGLDLKAIHAVVVVNVEDYHD